MTVNQPTVIIHVKYLRFFVPNDRLTFRGLVINTDSRREVDLTKPVCLQYVFVKVRGGSRTGASGARPLVRKYFLVCFCKF